MSVVFSPLIREIRIHLCQTSVGSKGVRDFLTKHYVQIKQANPNCPILVRECNGIQAKIWARYEKGKESSATLANLSADDVATTLKRLVN